MLDDLLGRGFAAKVKSLIKVTKARIEAVRKKRNATHKFLKRDIAHLLANGLDINAFGRADGLVTELIVSSCYDFLEHCCECLLRNLSALQKKRECSDECKVAVASLMFAAARFSDLPELRDLRQIFHGRYGNSFDHYINQKFAKNTSAKPASMESKLQLMQEIALQYSIVWNAKAFEQRMSISPVSTQKEHLDHGSFFGADSGINTASNYRTESANNCSSLRGLFDMPNQNSKENANSINEARNEMSSNGILSSNVNRSSNNNEDTRAGRVESVLTLFKGKNVTGIHDHNNGEFSSRRAFEVSDAHESHSHSKFRGFEVSHMVDSHIAKESFPRRSKNIEAQNHQKNVTYDRIQLGSFSQEIKLNFVTGGHKSPNITENTTPQGIFHRETDICSTGDQQLTSESGIPCIGSPVSSNQKRQNTLLKRNIHAGDEAKIKHFRRPPYVKPSKLVQDTECLGPKDARSHEYFAAPQVRSIEDLRLKSGSSPEGTRGKFDNPQYVKSNNGHMKPPKAGRHVAISDTVRTGMFQKSTGRRMDAIEHARSKSGQITLHESVTQVNERGRTMHKYQSKASVDHEDIARLILPKPQSTRRRSTRSSSKDSSHIEGSDKCDEKRTVSRSSNRRRRRESRRIKQLTSVDIDMDIPIRDEDKLLDNLLIHYSSKPSNPDIVEDTLQKPGEVEVTAPFPPRSVSLPREQSVPLQPTKVFTRAATFQLDRAAQHVHPKLPDYDDLAARFSSMKAKF